MFTSRDFPGRRFSTLAEFQEAQRLQQQVEADLEKRRVNGERGVKVVAQIVPLGNDALERRVAVLEDAVRDLHDKLASKDTEETEKPLDPGTILYGESRGQRYTLEVLKDGYLCNNGEIYKTLSGAALGVSGNRRSGWRFWRNERGVAAGEVTGRFEVSGQ